MIIEVKATRSAPAETVPTERYALKQDKRGSRTPYAFAVFLIGLGLYLKSIFPSWASREDGPYRGEDDKEGHAEPLRAVAQAEQVDRDLQTGATVREEPGAVGSGSRLVDLQPPARFMSADAPEIGEFLPPESPLVWSDSPELSRAGSPAANDNFGEGIPSPGGPGEPGEPGGPEEPGGGEPAPCDGTTCQPVDPACGCDGGGSKPPAPQEKERPDDDDACGCGSGGASSGGNRAPRVSGPVYLADVGGCALLVIGLADLLRHATDPDGDVLSVSNLVTSSGTLVQSDEGWRYGPDTQFTGPVTLTYEISDGALTVQQVAHFSVVGRSFFADTDGDDMLTGTTCADNMGGGAGGDHIEGLGGGVISGGEGDDRLYGGDGDDVIFGGPGDDVILGGDGDDQLWGGPGNDRIYGGAGDDIIFGGDGNDFVSGGDGNDIIHGGDGDDVVFGGAGDDVIDGGSGDDRLYGGDGDDVIRDGAGSDIVLGSAGDDHVIAALDAADDIYDGGEGHDTLYYSAATRALEIDLVNGIAGGVEIGNDTISGFETVFGGAGDDHFIIGGAPVTVGGGGGENIFEFTSPPPDEASEHLAFEILDFKVGDRIRMSKYDLFEKVFDKFEDEFEKIYGNDIDDDDVRIRYRHESDDERDRTVIEADFNRDDIYETTITLEGRHLLVIVENA